MRKLISVIVFGLLRVTFKISPYAIEMGVNFKLKFAIGENK
jgi:hypothetical protein